MLCSLFQRNLILLTTPAVNAFLNILRRRKQTANSTTPCMSYNSPYLSILKAFTIPTDLILRLICLLQTKRKLLIGSRILSLFPDIFHFFVSTYLPIVQPNIPKFRCIASKRAPLPPSYPSEILCQITILKIFPVA